MTNMKTVEVKAFVPARDFALSKQFYQDLGFVLAWPRTTWHASGTVTRVSCCRISTTKITQTIL